MTYAIPHLRRYLLQKPTAGLLEILSRTKTLHEVIWTDKTTGMAFLPTVLTSPLTHPAEILASTLMVQLFETLREAYEFVLIDTSPLALAPEVHVVSDFVDSFILVVEWGRTMIAVVREML